MKDYITLPRAVVEEVTKTLMAYLLAFERERPMFTPRFDAALAILTAALAEPPVKREPVAYLYHDAQTAQDAHPLMHSTMLVLATDRRPEYRNETPLYTAPPEPATDEQVCTAYESSKYEGRLDDFSEGWREAEEFHKIRKEDKA